MVNFDNDKMFYTISEVAEMLALEPYVLRFWEKEFKQIKPKKQAGKNGKRLYRTDDVKILESIKDLLYKQGFTIKGANKYLSSSKVKEILGGKDTQVSMDFIDEDSEDKKLNPNAKIHVQEALNCIKEIEEILKD